MHARRQFVRALWELFSASRRLGDLLHGPSHREPGLAHTTERPYSHRIARAPERLRVHGFPALISWQAWRSWRYMPLPRWFHGLGAITARAPRPVS
jgi:hypothetical protein